MNKYLLILLSWACCTMPSAAEERINFFDPADCDSEGWLWLNNNAVIDKYIGLGKDIQLLPANYTVKQTEYPYEETTPSPLAHALVDGYGTEGKLCGAGALVGGIRIDAGEFRSDENRYGGGFIFSADDIAECELFISSSSDAIDCYLEFAREKTDYGNLRYLTLTGAYEKPHLLDSYQGRTSGFGMLGYNPEDSNPKSIVSQPGEARTVAFQNLTPSPIVIHAIKIMMHGEDASVEDLESETSSIHFEGKWLVSALPLEVHGLDGGTVCRASDGRYDTSALPKGIYIAKSGTQTLKFIK